MKILQVNTTLNSGSTGRIAEQIGLKVIESLGASLIAYSRKGNDSASSTYQIGSKFDVYRHVLETRLFDNHGFSSKKATVEFIKYIKAENPDIIHLHNIHGYYINIEVLFNYFSEIDKPIVWTLHDCWAFTGHCSYFDRVNCTKWKTECSKCPLTKYYPESWFYDNSNKNFKRKKELFNKPIHINFVTPSNWLNGLVKESFLNKYSTETIYNGVDLKVFKPIESEVLKKYNIEKSKIILGVASIWDSRKGFNDFLVLAKSISNDYKIVLVGLTNDLIKVLPENIIGIERTENIEELAKLYTSADVYLNPTYSDNFPTTNIEALACGTPVITYNTGGSPEAIDSNTGIVVEKGNINKLLKAIEKVIESKDVFTEQLCRERVERLFNKEERYQDYINLYNKLLNV